MKAPRSRRSEALYGVSVLLVLANITAPMWLNEGAWEAAVLACVWLICLTAYLASRAQDVRRASRV